MTTKLIAILLLTLALAACDSSPTTENNAPANRSTPALAASPNTAEQASPAPAAATPSTPQFKTGDKVKVTSNGSSSDATVVSVDEKLGKVVVKMAGGEEKTVALGDVTKQ